MLTTLRYVPLRGWLSLAVGVVGAAVLAFDVLSWAAQPRFVEVPGIRVSRVPAAALALDKAGIRWRAADSGAAVRVEAARVPEALAALEREGVGLSRMRRSGAAPELTEQERAERDVERQLNAFLATTVGSERAFASVALTLNRDNVVERRVRYGREGAVLVRQRERWRLRGTFRNGDGAYDDTEWGVDRTVQKVRFAPGVVERLSIALVVDRRLRGRDVRQLRRAVASAAGVNARRGDRVRVSRVPLSAARGGARDRATMRALDARDVAFAILALGIIGFLISTHLSLRRARRIAGEARAVLPIQ